MPPSEDMVALPAAEDGSWETVPTKGHWELRAEDWDAPIKTYGEIVKEVGAASSVYEAVLLCNEEQRETCISVFKTTAKQYGILIVVTKAEKTELWANPRSLNVLENLNLGNPCPSAPKLSFPICQYRASLKQRYVLQLSNHERPPNQTG